jgi:sec-independent protein translocase protein TatB
VLSIGLSEMVLIAVVALLVVGPERLPRLMRELGKRYGQLRRAADELRRAFVLEADRQDAEERMAQLRERRKAAEAARQRAAEATGAVAQGEPDAAKPVSEGP